VFIVSIYPSSIARCQHIKVNGTQCGSPSLKSRRLCFFHNRWREARIEFTRSGRPVQEIASLDLPVLEDANSVQVAIMQVLRLILATQLEPKVAGLLLYGLQTASLNLKHADFEPHQPKVVIEPRSVGDTLLGANVWDAREFEPDDPDNDLTEDDTEEENEEPEAAGTSQAASGGATLKAGGSKDKAEPGQLRRTRDAIRAMLTGEEHRLAPQSGPMPTSANVGASVLARGC
jgi:hypothetical protein